MSEPGEAADTSVRCIHWAARVPSAEPPFDNAHLRIFYPAKATGNDLERNTGMIPADADKAPFPVIVFFSGNNVGQEAYRWLAVVLAKAGYATVTFDWVGELFPGQYGLTPGVDVAGLRPDTYGSTCPTSALEALLVALTTISLTADTPLKGRLDLDRLVLGGHSAGGTVALLTAGSQWCPTAKAVFAYGAHTAASTVLGWETGTILDLSGNCPVLLLGGTEDGVIARSAHRYGEQDSADSGERIDPLARTLATLEPGAIADVSRQVTLEGANHFSMAYPVDPTSARAFLDGEEQRSGAELRREIVGTIKDFLAELLLP